MRIILKLTLVAFSCCVFLSAGGITVSTNLSFDIQVTAADAAPPKLRKPKTNQQKGAVKAKRPLNFKKPFAGRKKKQTSLLKGTSASNIRYKQVPGTWKGTASVKRLLQQARGKSGITVLGTYPSYMNKANQLGANRLNMPNSVYQKNNSAGLSKYNLNRANTVFLDRAARRRDTVVLSVNYHNKLKHSTTLKGELSYMMQVHKYRPNATGTKLHPPRR